MTVAALAPTARTPSLAESKAVTHRGVSWRTCVPIGLLLLVLLLATWLRFTGLAREGRWGDEYLQTMVSRMAPQYIPQHAAAQAQPPLDYLLIWAATRLGDSVVWMRLPAVLFGVAAVALTYLLGVRWLGRGQALLAALLVAVSPLHCQHSQLARPYTIFTAAFVVTLWTGARALERPDWRRLLAFAGSAAVTVLTRGMGPLVVVLVMGVVLTAGWLATARPGRPREDRQAWGRVWLATLLVGLAAIPLLYYMLSATLSWTVMGAGHTKAAEPAMRSAFSRLLEYATHWQTLPGELFGPLAGVVLTLAAIGLLSALVYWSKLDRSRRWLLATTVLAGPAYLLVYSVVVHRLPPKVGYAMFLLPAIALWAGQGLATLSMLFARCGRAGRVAASTAWLATAAAAVLVIAPVSAHANDLYRNPDWAGCADYLQGLVTPGDVILVVDDRPLGEYQPTFWGKFDWPANFDRPMAEAAWIFVVSEPHWARLPRDAHRCFVVLKHPMQIEPGDAYLDRGLQAPPPGWRLVKFRSLDLLVPRSAPPAGAYAAVQAGCEALLEVPMHHNEVYAIPYALLARLCAERGDTMAARHAYEQARQLVPADRQDWFDRVTVRTSQQLYPN